jgi:hypothetical protein
MKKLLNIEDLKIPKALSKILSSNPSSGYAIKDFCLDSNGFMKYGYFLDYNIFLKSKNMNLQRDLVWDLNQKQQLVLSVLKGTLIPPLIIIQYKDDANFNSNTILKIIDGKQRLNTLVEFYEGKFHLDINNEKYYFEDLDDKLKITYKLYNPSFYTIYEYYDERLSDDDLILIFSHINFSGTPQDIEHINNLNK